jgi:hypothetical protein
MWGMTILTVIEDKEDGDSEHGAALYSISMVAPLNTVTPISSFFKYSAAVTVSCGGVIIATA